MANVTSQKEETKTPNDETRKEEKHAVIAKFKTGDYTAFTGFYGVFQGFGSIQNMSCMSRHDSVNNANQRAIQLFTAFTKNSEDDSVGCIDIMRDDPFWAFATVGYGSNTLWVEVRELEIEKCQLSELKNIARRENVDISSHKTKKKLLQKLTPLIQHKKHLNLSEDIDFERCELCKINNPDKYTKFKREKEKNPLVIRGKLIKNMYRKKLLNPIKEREVRKTYGFDENELEKAVLNQQIHFQRKVCFGNEYRLYEKSEVIKYYEKMQKLKKEESESISKKRKMELSQLDCTDIAKEPVMKKRKVRNTDTDNIDYKGVPQILRELKWLYLDCNELSDDGRKRIIEYLTGKYTRNDVESEDVLLKRVENVYNGIKCIKESIFRMCFKTKKWQKLCISKKVCL